MKQPTNRQNMNAKRGDKEKQDPAGPLYYLQKKIMLRPTALARDFRFSFELPFREHNEPFDAGANFNFVQFYPPDRSAAGVVLYFHGNRDNIRRYAKHAPLFTRFGYEVWMGDYPEFGKSTGRFTEERVYEQALILYGLAEEAFDASRIILYGKSLGSGVASWLAARRPCRHLVLETPYFSMLELFRQRAPRFLSKKLVHFQFPNYENIHNTRAPVTIFHGTRDRVIPYPAALQLRDYLKPGDDFVTLRDASHNNVAEYATYHRRLASILNPVDGT